MLFQDYFAMLRFAKPHRKIFILAVVSMAFTALFDCVSIGMILPMVDRVIGNSTMVFPTKLPPFFASIISSINLVPRLQLLYWMAYGAAFLFLVKGLFTFLQTYFMSKVGQLVVRDIRNLLYQKLQDLSLEYFIKKRSGELISRITNDVRMVENAVSYAVTDLFYQSFQVMFFAILIFTIYWRWAFFAIFLIPLIGLPIAHIGKRLRKLSKQAQEKMADINSTLVETINGVRIVRAFSMEEYEIKKFRDQNQSFYSVMMKAIKRAAIVTPLTELFGVVFGMVFLVWGGKKVIEGAFSFGVFAFFLGSMLSMIRPFKKLSQVNAINQQALAATQRIDEVLHAQPTVAEQPNARLMTNIAGTIEFDRITFSYEKDVVLKDISLKVRHGDIIAIAGPSGAGKSTLVDLLLRFYDPQKGKVLIDGIDIRSYSIKSLRSFVGIVTQETILFHDTVRENIAYGRKDASLDMIIRAAKEALAHDFIMKLPNGYDTVIGDRGVKLSGGERQRIAIARAILKNPPILILDEATSQLDAESERLVQETLNRLVEGRTVFMIGHRLSSLRNATKIIVLSSGRVVEEGTHEELIRLPSGLYKKLFETQTLGAFSG